MAILSIATLGLAALGIGIVLGMFGAGGGMITVPALIYLAGLPVKEAIAMSLWVVATVSVFSIVQQKIWRVMQVKLLLTFGITGIMGSVTGALLAKYIPETLQMVLFSALIFAVTWWMSRIKLTDQVSVFKFIPASISGFLIGVLTGVLGVGGGFLLVPALIYLGIGHFPTAVANSLVLIAINSLAGGLTYLKTTSVSFSLALTLSAVAALGSVLGAYGLKRLPATQLQKAFSVLLVTLGAFMLWRTLAH